MKKITNYKKLQEIKKAFVLWLLAVISGIHKGVWNEGLIQFNVKYVFLKIKRRADSERLNFIILHRESTSYEENEEAIDPV